MLYPYPNDGLEATLLSQAHLLWSGQQLYQPFELYRFVSSPYPPWHPLILGFAEQFPGLHPFWNGRLISLIAALFVLLVVALSVRLASRSWLAAVFAPLLLASAPPFELWATRIKPDMYALLWTSLGLLCVVCTVDGGRRTADSSRNFARRSPFTVHQLSFAFLAALCFALAFFTKQTALAGPLAAGLGFVLGDLRTWQAADRTGFVGRFPIRWRTLWFGFTYLLLVGVTWALLDIWSHGQFTFHIWTQHRDAVWTPQLMFKYVGLLADSWPLILLGLTMVLLAWRDERLFLLACYLLVAPLTLYGAGKTGANHNHLLETLLALTLAGGSMLGWAFAQFGRKPLVGFVVCAVVALQFGLDYTPLRWYGGELEPSDDSPKRYVELVRSLPGEVLADEPGIPYLAGKPLRYDDPSGFGPVAHSGLWDQRGLLDDIANQRFSAILVDFTASKTTEDATGRWTPEMIAAIRDHYKLLFDDSIKTYVPK